MIISVIIPTYNEINYIDNLLNSLLANDIKEMEIILADGGSTDGTIDRIKTFSDKYPFIKLVNNTDKFVNFGFNKAFKISTGKFVTLMGAHAKYPPNFLKTAIEHLENDDCDAVGGPLIQKGGNRIGTAIAFVMSSKFGVGNTEFRVSNKKQYVQSVAFAVYKRDVFEKIGLLDEDLIKNHDDEFHYRMNKHGFKILMIPEMACEYFVRNSYKSLFIQYFNYGLFKPLVFKKLKHGIKFRHIIPALVVIYFLLFPLGLYYKLYWLPYIIYLIVILLLVLKLPGLKLKFYAFLAFPVIHLAYGLGFLIGLFKRK